MSFSRKHLAAANLIIEKRKSDAKSVALSRKNEIFVAVPSVKDCYNQLSQTGLALAKSFTMGDKAKSYIEELGNINLSIQAEIKKLLIGAGYPQDYLETPYTCKKCEDTGFVDGRFCTCRRDLLIKLSVEELENSSPAVDCKFDNFDVNYYSPQLTDAGFSPRSRMSEIKEFCKAYSADFDKVSPSLYLYGATGLGKTHLSLAVANEVVRKGYSVKYGSAQNIFSSLEREKFGSNTNEFERELLEADLLIIDDLGSEFATQFTISALYNVINTRLNLSKPIIISTNLTVQELENKYTQRITSRIIGNYTSLLFYGSDIRQIKRYEE